MNHETIQNFLNTPIDKLFRDEVAIENAKENLKRYESFNNLLKDKIDCFKECRETVSLELLTHLSNYPEADRNYIIGFTQGINSLLICFERYQQAKEYLHKEGV